MRNNEVRGAQKPVSILREIEAAGRVQSQRGGEGIYVEETMIGLDEKRVENAK